MDNLYHITDRSRHLDQGTGREVVLGDRPYLFFGGTAYLGLNLHTGFATLFKEGLDRYGLNNGTSRTNNVQLGIYEDAEKYAAKKFSFGDAVLLSSGYLAAQLAVRQISKNYSPDQILYSPCCHPALWLDGKPASAGEFADWANATVEHINNSKSDSFLIISNTLDNVQPQRFDFSVFQAIQPGKKVHFILDDSHGLGVFDPSETSVRISQKPELKLTVVASLAKGTGIDAGIILADQQTIDELRKTGVFVGASPSAPAFLYAFLNGGKIYQEQWEKLRANIRFFKQHLPHRNEWMYIEDYPVFYSPGKSYFDHLAANQILISSFPYPDPNDPPLDRIVLSAAHTQEDLEKLISLL